MIKQTLFFFTVLLSVTLVCFFLHDYYLKANQLHLNFSLLAVYVFYLLTATVIYLLVLITYYWREDQAGYVFLVGVFVKMGLFVLIFNTSILQKTQFEMFEKASLLIPFLEILIIEAVFVYKILNSKRDS